MGAVVGTNAVAMVHLTDCTEDPGVIELSERLAAMARDFQRRNLASRLPEGLRGLSEVAALSRGNWDPSYLPEVVVAADGLAPSNEVFVVGASLDGLPKVFSLPFRVALRNAGKSGGAVSYRGQSMMHSGDGVVMFMDATLLFATDLDGMRGAVDRVLDGAPPTRLRELVSPSYAEQWDLYGIVQNRGNVLGDLLADWRRDRAEKGADPLALVPLAQIEDGWIGVDVVSADRIRAELVMNCSDEANARLLLDKARYTLEQALGKIDDQMIDVVLNGECIGRRATLAIDIVGVSRLIEHELEKAMLPAPTPPAAEAAPSAGDPGDTP
jgi:hypothetical protein